MRLFVGIDLPDEIKQSILKFQAELKQLGVRGFWKAPDNFHMTLEFLGELDSKTLPLIRECLSSAGQDHSSFALTLGGLGAFPSFKRPHTLWTAVGGSIRELNQLQNEIHTLLTQKGFSLENRQFKPHITLASRPDLREIELGDHKTRKLGEFRVEGITLFASSVIRGKRTYTALSHKKLQ
ncbi:RNA 2',3'-cyclic phosphodiesterase [Desulfosporosinus sp. PR]|uniref:RNA 2',3'-cyclic phosphodiesterase n=1 Tax=Candidatus Desulfosporosinus nitrosoreducens TaxID=3401928 RepID=UPI0027F70B68|nr:RNA 2',3'-cyclic phosphodiesterase [Desulfosporosinus sp. PR]MDQ7095848.1 RNA 2',3'-cyclic phosphodiesterase [Desulfosporosinus sp. PR]